MGLHRASTYLLQRFSTRPKKDKLQISHSLDEFVLQICILGLSERSPLSVGAGLPQQAPLALEHTDVFAKGHIARASTGTE